MTLRANDSHGPVVEERVLPGTPVENPRGCPACGGELGAYDLVCWTCGTKVRHLPPVENLTPQMRELQGIAAGAIANAMASMLAGRRLGLRLSIPEDLLQAAQRAAIHGNFPVALELASRSGEEAETLAIAFEALQGRLRKARHLIALALEEGADITEAERLLEMASGASEAGDYRGALRYAIKAGQKAEERRGGVTAWKVEIGDWLK